MVRLDTFQFKSQLDSAKSITLMLPDLNTFESAEAAFDAVASALSLKISFEGTGKSVSVLCPTEMTVEFNRLVGVNTVSNFFGSRDLVITFPGQTELVDKVSYNLEKGELQLVVSPKSNAPDLDYQKLRFFSGTKKADFTILIGVNRLSDLGPFYAANKDYFTANPLVSFTLNPPADNYTNIQLFESSASSFSELTVALLDNLSYPLNLDTATNLLSGLEIATDSFSSPSVTAVTFETAARLLRSGAVRSQPLSAANYPPGSIPTQTSQSAVAGYGTDSQNQDVEPQKEDKKVDQKENPTWYEPKIYQGSMLP